MPAKPNSPAQQKILITGAPGIGKTTVIMRLAEILTGRRLAGFYTEEIREGKNRKGFRAITFAGQTTILAHVDFKTGPRVGRYRVNIPDFEQSILPELDRPCDLILIDEIGKMECFSDRFVTAVRRLLEGAAPFVATVALKGPGLIDEIKTLPQIQLHRVTHANRDALGQQLAGSLSPAQ